MRCAAQLGSRLAAHILDTTLFTQEFPIMSRRFRVYVNTSLGTLFIEDTFVDQVVAGPYEHSTRAHRIARELSDGTITLDQVVVAHA
jgi:hypothetical protein